jgi:hypothetical protein
VHDVAYLVGLGLRYRAQADGCPPLSRHRRLLALLTEASISVSVSDDGRSDVRDEADPAGLVTGDGDGPIQADTAAQMLGLTSRQVRRLADLLGGRRIGRAWVFDRAAVSAEAVRREETRCSH